MKYIYITMVQLPTVANKITKLMTGSDYSHASLSFDENLSTLYSFQVKNRKVFLVGGFVEETQDMYFHGKNVSLKETIFKVPVADNEHAAIVEFVKQVGDDKEYMFNYVSALLMFTFGGVKSYKAYHCIEFVSEALLLTKAVRLPKPPCIMKPPDLYQVLEPFKIKSDQIHARNFEFKNDPFMKRIKSSVAMKKSLYSVKEAICRAVLQRTSKNFNCKNVNFCDEDTIV